MLITTAHQRCLTSLAVADKRIPEWLSVICSLQNWGLVCWEATSGVKSGVLCHSSSVLLPTRDALEWKAKFASSLTDVWQQLFEQHDIRVICTIHCMKTTPLHQRLETPLKPTRRNMFICRNQWGTSMSWSSMWLICGQQPAELHRSSDWSVARLF